MARGHIHPRGENVWQIKVERERDPVTGKRRISYETVRGPKKDAEKRLTAMLREFDTGETVEPHKLTVSQFLDKWLADIKTRISAKSYERYAEIVEKHLKPVLGAHKLVKLSPVQISGAYAQMLERGRRDGKGGLSAQTVKSHHRILHQALAQGVKWQLLVRNPADAVDPPRPQREEMKILDHAQTAQLLKAIARTQTYMPVLLAVTTSMRRGEVLALRWSDIDLDGARLQVVRSLEQTKEGLRFKQPKTAKGRRTITLPGYVVEELKKHRAKQAELRLKLGLPKDPTALVISTYRKDEKAGAADQPREFQPMSPRSLTHEFARLVRRAKVPVITFHGLRHTHMSHLLAAGVNPKIASERAGHASVGITLDLYSHVLPGLQEDVAKQVDVALRKAMEG